MKIKYVPQKKDNDCVLACIAMVSGLSYPKTLKTYLKWSDRDHYRPIPSRVEYEFLKHLGVGVVVQRFPNTKAGNVYILTVPSLNFVGVNHRVVMELKRGFGQSRLYDPSRKKKYEKVLDLKGYSNVFRVKR